MKLFSVKSRLVLPLWYRLTWVVPEEGVCMLHTVGIIFYECLINAHVNSQEYAVVKLM